MKEIFDWLREQIYGNNDKAKNFSKDTHVVNKEYVDNIINEAEAKWKEDCCEWKLEDEEANLYVTKCEQRQLIFEGTPTDNDYMFCPYCGKRIKISEVE